jgi:hypothetical protein
VESNGKPDINLRSPSEVANETEIIDIRFAYNRQRNEFAMTRLQTCAILWKRQLVHGCAVGKLTYPPRQW